MLSQGNPQCLRVCRARCRTEAGENRWAGFSFQFVFPMPYSGRFRYSWGLFRSEASWSLWGWWGHFHLAEWIERLFTGAFHPPAQGSMGCAPWLVRQNNRSCCKGAGNHLCKAVQKALNSGTSLMFIGT